jgi:hypothetical protein
VAAVYATNNGRENADTPSDGTVGSDRIANA